jgi:hypothetical protein
MRPPFIFLAQDSDTFTREHPQLVLLLGLSLIAFGLTYWRVFPRYERWILKIPGAYNRAWPTFLNIFAGAVFCIAALYYWFLD